MPYWYLHCKMRCTLFVQSLLGDGTILHSFQHGGIGIGKAVGHQQQVCTGLQRLDRRLTGGIHIGDGLHRQRIRHDQALIAQLPAQKIGQHDAGKGGRGIVPCYLRHGNVGRHNQRSIVHIWAKGTSSQLRRSSSVLFSVTVPTSGILAGIAMAWGNA